MSNRKRVTLTFEIDDHVGFNDEAFMRHDFLQELVCCVNEPYADTFVMKVEDADAPQDMSAVEYIREYRRMHSFYFGKPATDGGVPGCGDCPCRLSGKKNCIFSPTRDESSIPIVEAWAREHPERSEDNVGL